MPIVMRQPRPLRNKVLLVLSADGNRTVRWSRSRGQGPVWARSLKRPVLAGRGGFPLFVIATPVGTPIAENGWPLVLGCERGAPFRGWEQSPRTVPALGRRGSHLCRVVKVKESVSPSGAERGRRARALRGGGRKVGVSECCSLDPSHNQGMNRTSASGLCPLSSSGYARR